MLQGFYIESVACLVAAVPFFPFTPFAFYSGILKGTFMLVAVPEACGTKRAMPKRDMWDELLQ